MEDREWRTRAYTQDVPVMSFSTYARIYIYGGNQNTDTNIDKIKTVVKGPMHRKVR